MPVVRVGVEPPPGSFLFSLQARAKVMDQDALRDAMTEHVYSKRAEFLAPYL